MVLLLDSSGSLKAASPSFFLQYSSFELNSPISLFFTEADATKFKDSFIDFLKMPDITHLDLVATDDLPYRVIISPPESKNLDGIVAKMSLVSRSEIKSTEHALKLGLDELKSFRDAIEKYSLMWILRWDYRIFYQNPKVTNLKLPHPPNGSFFDFLAGDAEIEATLIQAKLQINQEYYGTIYFKNDMYLNCSFIVLKESEFYLVVANDVTEEINQKMLMDKERAKFLHESRLAIIGNQFSELAHELKNPFTVIKMSASKIEKLINSQRYDEILGNLEKITKNVDRGVQIIENVRRQSRTDAGAALSSLSVSQLLADLKDNVGPYLHQIELTVQADEQLKIQGTDFKVMQILVNLVRNACDHLQEHPNLPQFIQVNVSEENQKVNFVIRDGGPGIPPQILTQLFRPFFTTKTADKGTGIGLSASKTLAQEMQGNLEYQLVDQHTAFILTLPKG